MGSCKRGKVVVAGMVAAAGLSALSGCASIVSGKMQPVSVETRLKGRMVSGATCELLNDKGKWYVNTPGSMMIQKSYQDLSIRCEKEGLEPGLAIAKSASSMVWGNILFGGPIGAAVDASSGAGYDYPPLFQVELGVTTTVIEAPRAPQPDRTP